MEPVVSVPVSAPVSAPATVEDALSAESGAASRPRSARRSAEALPGVVPAEAAPVAEAPVRRRKRRTPEVPRALAEPAPAEATSAPVTIPIPAPAASESVPESPIAPEAPDPAPADATRVSEAPEPEPDLDTDAIRFNLGAIAMPLPEVPAVAPEVLTEIVAEEPAKTASLGMRVLRGVGVFASAASIVGLIFGTTVPAYTPDPNDPRAAAVMATQKLLASGGTVAAFDPGGFEALEPAEMQAEQNLLSSDSFQNNTKALVQYPFSHGVPLTDGFGWRDYPVAQLHDAQDFAAGNGAAVRAIADGVVLESGPVADGCGTGVRLQHTIDGQDVQSRYCHMQTDSNPVQVGDTVKVGQLVGLVGQTGLSFGPHLHLVIRVDGKAIDPMPFLAKYNAKNADPDPAE